MSKVQDPHCRSLEKDDQIQRSTKKIKDNSSTMVDVEEPIKAESGAPKQGVLHGGSYKDKVMEIDSNFNFQLEEIMRMVTEDLFPDMDHARNSDNTRKVFNPNPTVSVDLEEYEKWCNPWKFNLIVKLMGKRVGLRFMSSKLKHLWAKKGDGIIAQDPKNSENIESNLSPNQESSQVEIQPVNKEEEPIIRPWMLAKKTPRRKPRTIPQKTEPTILNQIESNSIRKETSTTRFDALQNIPEDYNESTIEKEKVTSNSSNQKPMKVDPSKVKSNSSKMINSQPNPQKRSNNSQKDQQKKGLIPTKGDPLNMDKNNFLETPYGGSTSSTRIGGYVGQPEPEKPPDPHLGIIQSSDLESNDRKIPA
ncbi:hypothetical protein SESBI_02389 [Sesbania bispinosa]|nr:hypothetical protein SESBI_02389 [Sesbania bispinosa]